MELGQLRWIVYSVSAANVWKNLDSIRHSTLEHLGTQLLFYEYHEIIEW